MNKVIDIEGKPEMAVAIRPQQAVAARGLFGTDDPVAVIGKASEAATALKNVLKKQGLISNISGKEYPKVEAWTLLGTMIGVFPVNVWTRKVEGGWEARVEARTRDGSVVGAAEAQCLNSERNWGNRDDFALRSMAQTRATAKCLRMPLGFVMTLAGYEATPAEEMGHDPRPQDKKGWSTPQKDTKPLGQPRQTPAQPTKNDAPPPKREVQPAIFADEDTRKRMIAGIQAAGFEKLAVEYFSKLTNPTLLLPNEGLEDVPLRWVPVMKSQMKALLAAITDFGNGAEAKHPYPANPEPPAKEKPVPPPPATTGETRKEPPSVTAAKAKNPEWFWDVAISVPRKGMKKTEYDRLPDTIRSLYDAMKAGDDEAQKRLWGLVHHWNPEPRTVNGRTYQPSEADHITREALDAFADYEEKHHGDRMPGEDNPDASESHVGTGAAGAVPQVGPEEDVNEPF